MSSCSLVICVLYVFWKINICQTYLQIFFHLLGCFFSFFYGFLCFPLLWRSFLVQCSPTCLFLLLLTFTIVWNQAAWYFQLCSSSSRLISLFWVLSDSIWILKLFYIYICKKCHSDWIELALNLYIALQSMNILTILSPPNHAHRISFFLCLFKFLSSVFYSSECISLSPH